MKKKTANIDRLFTVVMVWTVFTTVFAWLPLMRAIARPEGYTWGLFGLRGVGTGGPFWIFPSLAAYAVFLLSYAWHRYREPFRVLLIVWHLGWAGLLLGGWMVQGSEARWQGQGWGFDISFLLPALLYAGFGAAAVWWAILDWRRPSPSPPPRWTTRNTARLLAAIGLLPVAFLLFRFGSDYNWVTAVAIGVTIVQWITFSAALEPIERESGVPLGGC